MPLDIQTRDYLQNRAMEAEQAAMLAPVETQLHLAELALTWRRMADDYATFFTMMKPRL